MLPSGQYGYFGMILKNFSNFTSQFIEFHFAPAFYTTASSIKPTSQENINPAMLARFLLDAYFARSVARRPIFLTLNNVKSPSGRQTAGAGRLFSHRLILSANDKIFGRCPADVPAMIAQGSCRSPPDDNESCGHWPFTFW